MIALALRSNIPVTVNQEVFETNSIDLIIDNANEIEEFKEFIKDIKPEDFLNLIYIIIVVDCTYATGLYRSRSL